MSGFTRRRFLQAGTALAASGITGAPGRLLAEMEGAGEGAAEARARVVLIRHRDAVTDDGRTDGAVVHHMLNQAVQRLLDVDSSGTAWQRLVGGAEVVGIKSNVWRRLPTPPELEEAIREEVIAAGVSADNIAVDDRGVEPDRW